MVLTYQRTFFVFCTMSALYDFVTLKFAVLNVNTKITGVYADVDFQEEDLVLKDQMLVGAQHMSNKVVRNAWLGF